MKRLVTTFVQKSYFTPSNQVKVALTQTIDIPSYFTNAFITLQGGSPALRKA